MASKTTKRTPSKADQEARAAKLAALQQQITDGVAALTDAAQWRTLLGTAAKFHRYSLGNLLLIARQRPDATQVAGFSAWKELGRTVRKGEKGIAILAPFTVKPRDEDLEKDPDAKPRVLFRAVYVFDIAQTEGAPLSQPTPVPSPELLAGDGPAGLYEAVAAQITAAGFQLERGDCDGGANGYTSWDRMVVRVRADVDDAHAVKTLIHEWAHIRFGHGRSSARDYRAHRGVCEVEAESVAYILCVAHGLATADYSLPYVAGWSDGDAKIVKATADGVVRTASAMLDELEGATIGAAELAAA